MKAHDWFIEHRAEFAARTLDPDDEATFHAHLDRCPECREEVGRIEVELAWLPLGVTPVTPRPGLKRRIIDRALGVAWYQNPRWALTGAAAACLLGLAGGWYGGSRQSDALAQQLALNQDRLAALRDTVSVMRDAARVLQASVEVDGQRGGLVIFADPKTHRWNVVMHGLPPAPANARYQFWFHCADGMVRGAEIQIDPTRPAMFTTGMPSQGGQVMGAALTLEPMDATDGPPRGKELAHLML